MGKVESPGGVSLADGSPWGLCEPFMRDLPITGALLSVVDGGGRRSTIAATDLVATRWDELELELGTGPLHEAAQGSTPQLVGDVRASTMNPIIGAHFERLGIRGLFAFPLLMGSATVGVAGLYRTTPGDLPDSAIRTALSLARTAAVPAVREALYRASLDADLVDDAGPGLRREVHQATGMVSAQLDVTTTEAFARLRAFALASDRSITAVSRDVVEGRLDFLDLD